jgi:hypothetical protein
VNKNLLYKTECDTFGAGEDEDCRPEGHDPRGAGK